MYTDAGLPKKMEGKWIWHGDTSEGDFDRLFLKKDFSLLEIPATAEMWIASHLFFTVFINGRPCTAGPIPSPGLGKEAYAMRVDITHLVDVGTNHIFIMAHRENTPLAGVRYSIPGIWLQVNIDGTPAVCSDESWICKVPNAFMETGLLTAPCGPFTEQLDLRNFNRYNLTAGAEELLNNNGNGYGPDWKPVDYAEKPGPASGTLIPFDQLSSTADLIRTDKLAWKGTFKQNSELIWISFADIIKQQGKQGLYIAATHVYCPPGENLDTVLVCDEPYMLFVNGVKVKSQAVPPLPLRMDLEKARRSEKLTPGELANPSFVMKLKSGWNYIMFAQECQCKTSSAVILWPDLPRNALEGHQEPSFDSPAGWVLAGPVNAPMSLLYPNFPLNELKKAQFIPGDTTPPDASAAYMTCAFNPAEKELQLELPMELNGGDYIILDFGKTCCAFPTIKLEGSSGDIIDIICGDNCRNGEVLAYETGFRRNTSTLILSGKVDEWLASTPKGLQYMMITVRKAAGKVRIFEAGLWQELMEHATPGSFQSSSPTMDLIWKTGVRTLETTMQRIFMDSPTKEQAQALPDAMIQSWAAYYVFGEYSRAERAIREFAKSQLETGDMNALSPSGLYQALPDYSLTWPVWLQRHYLHTGSKDFLEEMMPYLQRLMAFYNEIATRHDEPLGDLREYQGMYAFLDHGPIDRAGISTGLNGIYCRALLSASWLAEQSGNEELSMLYKERASKVASKIWQLCWDESKGMFADGFNPATGFRSAEYSWQSNVLAIYGGMAKPAYYGRIWSKLFSDQAPLELKAAGEFNNPFFKYYVLEAAFALGKAPWALSLIHYYWGRMAKAGAKTWWEMYDPGSEIDQKTRLCSKCQGYGVSSSCYLISELVGIRPAEPGMHMVYFNPVPGDVSWVKASVPTPHGSITIHWKMLESGTFEVNISSSYLVEIIPVLDPKIAEQAIFTVSDKVSILAPDNG